MSLDRVRELTGASIAGVLAGCIDPATAGSVASLARAYVAVSQALVMDGLEERLASLEAELDRRDRAS